MRSKWEWLRLITPAGIALILWIAGDIRANVIKVEDRLTLIEAEVTKVDKRLVAVETVLDFINRKEK